MNQNDENTSESTIPEQIMTKEQLWLVEKLVEKLSRYSLMAAVESARMGKDGREVTLIAEQMQTMLNSLDSLLFMYINTPKAEMLFAAGLKEGDSISDRQIKGKIGQKFPEMLLMIAKSLEKILISALAISFQKENRPLCISFEELRKTVMNIYREFVPADARRKEWYNGQRLELSNKPLTPKSFDFFSFNFAGLEIVEEIGYIHKIFDYESIENQIRAQEPNAGKLVITVGSEEVRVDQYIDLYDQYKFPKPQDRSAMCVVVLQFINDCIEMVEDVEWHKSKIVRVAFPVDCFNYPFTSKIGKTVETACKNSFMPYIKESWQWMDGRYFASGIRFKIDEIKDKQLHFLDWPKILQINA